MRSLKQQKIMTVKLKTWPNKNGEKKLKTTSCKNKNYVKVNTQFQHC